jgi:hypothetical protein
MGRQERRTWENLKERDHFEDIGEDGRIILKRSLKRMGGCGLDSDNWQDLVNTVMYLRIS